MKRSHNFRIAMVVAVVVLSFSLSARAQAPLRLTTAVIDVQRILAESIEGKKEIERIKKVQEAKLAQINQTDAEIQKLKDKLTDLGFSISEEERTKLQRTVEDKMIEADRFRKDADREVKSQFEDVFASFEKRIYPIIEALGVDKGIQLILNKDTPGLVWADKSLDITSDVIDRFNKVAAQGGAPAARPASAPAKR